LQTAEGALSEVSSMLQRFKELAVQGANPALSSAQRGFLSVEMGGLKSEIQSISTRTRFNGTSLLGAQGSLSFQTGETTTDTLTVSTSDIYTDTSKFSKLVELVGNTFTNGDGVGQLTTTEAFQALSSTIDSAIDEVATQRATYGSQVNRLNHNLNNLSALHENLSAANSRILDTDYANETAQLTKTQILQQAATAMLSQANAQPNVVLALLK
jgi:flagellin